MASAEEPPAADEAPLLDDMEPRTPMKRLGSTRKLAAFNNIRLQLAEQTRVLEARAEATAGVASELNDYCRRRADLEHEYSRALDKLARASAARHRDRPAEHAGAAGCWRAALDATRALARDHAALAALYGGALATRLARAADDAQRLHRKCRDVLAERHEEVAGALAAAQARGKRHAAAHHAWRHAALKLRAALDARNDPPKHKKVKALDKELEKRRVRHSGARAEALRARAEYALALEAANATLQRYYLDDVGDVILCMEVGFEAAVGRCARTAAAAEAARGAACGGAAGALRAAAASLDALADRQRLLDAHAAAFALPRPLTGPAPSEAAAVDALLGEAAPPEAEPELAVHAELEQRLRQLDAAARALRAECRENAKTLDAAEDELVKQMEGSDSAWDLGGVFGAEGGGAGAVPQPPPPPSDDQEDYYLAVKVPRVRVVRGAAGARGEQGRGAARAPGAGRGGRGRARARAGRPPRALRLLRAARPAPAARAHRVRARHRRARARAPGRVPRVRLARRHAGAAGRLRARRGAARPRRARGRALRLRTLEALPEGGPPAAAAAAAAGAAGARGEHPRGRGVLRAAAVHAGGAAAARRGGAALPVRVPGAPGRALARHLHGRVEPGRVRGAHAAGRARRPAAPAARPEPAQRARQADHPAARTGLPAGRGAACALCQAWGERAASGGCGACGGRGGGGERGGRARRRAGGRGRAGAAGRDRRARRALAAHRRLRYRRGDERRVRARRRARARARQKIERGVPPGTRRGVTSRRSGRYPRNDITY